MFAQVTWLRRCGVVLLSMLLGVATDAMAQFRYQDATRDAAGLQAVEARQRAMREVGDVGSIAAAYAHRGLGYIALDLEKEAGFTVTKADYDVLDRIVGHARAVIGTLANAPYSKEKALLILDALARVVATYCPSQVAEVGGGLYSAALRAQACDCDILSITYLTVAEAVGLPLYGILAPGHMMLLWDDGSTRFLWETTLASEKRRAHYIDWLHIAKVSLKKGRYLRKQSRQEMIGFLVGIRGNGLLRLGMVDQAIADFDRAVSLNPDLAAALNNRGVGYLALGFPEKARADFTLAIEMDPHFWQAYYGRGSAHFHLKQYAQALGDFDRVIALNLKQFAQAVRGVDWVIALNEGLADAYYGRGCAYQQLGKEKRAIKEYTRAIKFNSTMATAYLNRGLAYTTTQNYRRAINDFVAFISLASFDSTYQDQIHQVQHLLLLIKRVGDGKGPQRRTLAYDAERGWYLKQPT